MRCVRCVKCVRSLATNSFGSRFIRHFCSGKNLPRFLIVEYNDSPPQRPLQSSFQAPSLINAFCLVGESKEVGLSFRRKARVLHASSVGKIYCRKFFFYCFASKANRTAVSALMRPAPNPFGTSALSFVADFCRMSLICAGVSLRLAFRISATTPET